MTVAGRVYGDGTPTMEALRIPGERMPVFTKFDAYVAKLKADRTHAGKLSVRCALCDWTGSSVEEGREHAQTHRRQRGKVECGTKSGYARHYARSEKPCEPCRRAYSKFKREQRLAKKIANPG